MVFAVTGNPQQSDSMHLLVTLQRSQAVWPQACYPSSAQPGVSWVLRAAGEWEEMPGICNTYGWKPSNKQCKTKHNKTKQKQREGLTWLVLSSASMRQWKRWPMEWNKKAQKQNHIWMRPGFVILSCQWGEIRLQKLGLWKWQSIWKKRLHWIVTLHHMQKITPDGERLKISFKKA